MKGSESIEIQAKALRASEEHFRNLAEAIPQIVWTARLDGFLESYNRKWCEYTGLTLEQTQGWGWGPVLHPDDLQRCIDVWASSVQSGTAYEIEYRFKRASDGLYRWHLGRALPVRNLSGEVIKWFGTCTDIDDQKVAIERAQAAEFTLKASENRFRSIVEESPFATQLLAPDGRVTQVNKAWQEMWDVSDQLVQESVLKGYNIFTRSPDGANGA